MTHKGFEYYVDRYQRGIITEDELVVFRELLIKPENDAELDRIMKSQLMQWDIEGEGDFPKVVRRVRNAVDEQIRVDLLTAKPFRRVHFLRSGWFRYAAAAVILLFGIGTYLWFNNKQMSSLPTEALEKVVRNDVAPGGVGAILTLADGRPVVLDSMGNGIIAVQNGTEIRLWNGQLSYNPSGNSAGNVVHNIMSTPKGRQFKVTLPDGTRVWLNSNSSIRYPTAFNGNERKVDVTGEVYFEVVRKTNMPFKVKVSDDAEIQVLGTSFNINAYENEAGVKATLLEGSVRLSAYRQSQVIKPGQQAQITTGKKLMVVDDADVEKVIAWKNGYFNFKDADLYEVMRQLERWYDIDVVYAKPIRHIEFNGKLPRTLSLAQVLKILGEMQIKFKIEEGRKLIIEP